MKYILSACISLAFLATFALSQVPECPFPSNVITFFPNPENCGQYYECYKGYRYLMNCPKGLYWNQAILTCDYEGRVSCNITSTSPSPTTVTTTVTSTVTTSSAATTTPEATSTIVSSSTVTIESVCGGKPDGSFAPHPSDCGKYYECVNQRAIEEKCSGNLYWNQDISTCDYPENVDCTP